jgi:hypothetical protein
MWGLRWTKRHWVKFSSNTSVSLANHHSTDFSIIIITRGWHNRPTGGRSAEWIQLDSTPHYANLKTKTVCLHVFKHFSRPPLLLITVRNAVVPMCTVNNSSPYPQSVFMYFRSTECRSTVQAVSRPLPSRWPTLNPGSDHAVFVVDKLALGRVALEKVKLSLK